MVICTDSRRQLYFRTQSEKMTFFSVLVFSVVLLNSVNSSQTFEIFTRATDAFKSFLNIELITVDKPRSAGDSNETDSVAEDATLLAVDMLFSSDFPFQKQKLCFAARFDTKVPISSRSTQCNNGRWLYFASF